MFLKFVTTHTLDEPKQTFPIVGLQLLAHTHCFARQTTKYIKLMKLFGLLLTHQLGIKGESRISILFMQLLQIKSFENIEGP